MCIWTGHVVWASDCPPLSVCLSGWLAGINTYPSIPLSFVTFFLGHFRHPPSDEGMLMRASPYVLYYILLHIGRLHSLCVCVCIVHSCSRVAVFACLRECRFIEALTIDPRTYLVFAFLLRLSVCLVIEVLQTDCVMDVLYGHLVCCGDVSAFTAVETDL